MVTQPRLERTRSHVHEHHDSTFFVPSGNGSGSGSGSDIETAVFVGVRSDPTAQESVLMRPELDACVP